MPLFVAVVVAFGQKADPTQARFRAAYANLNAAYKANSVAAAKAWIGSNADEKFTYTSKQGQTFDRARFLAGIEDQFTQTKSVLNSTMTVKSVSSQAGRKVVVVSGRYEAVVTFDGADLLLTDVSESTDVWAAVGKGWKLISIKVTKEDVQMRQRK